MQRINKIYWITHPAFSAITEKKDYASRPAPAIASFVREKIVPAIERASEEPNSIVVLVKAADFRFKRGMSPRRIRQGRAIETRLEKVILQKLGNRAVVTKELGAKNSAPAVLQKISEKGFVLHKRAKIIGFGSFAERCAINYPSEFKKNAGLKSWIFLPKGGSLPTEPRRAGSVFRKRAL